MYPHKRRFGNRDLIKKFVISCEGSTTEKEYFKILQSLCWNYVSIEILTDKNKSSPDKVLERISKYNKSIKPGDELWCVVDRDNWTESQFEELIRWSNQQHHEISRGVAISNPKFEIWLLVHFQNMPSHCGASECIRLLKQYLPNYDKHLVPNMISIENIRQAISQTADNIPINCIGSNVGKLVEKITDCLKKNQSTNQEQEQILNTMLTDGIITPEGQNKNRRTR